MVEYIKSQLVTNFPNGKVEVFDSRGTGDHFSIIVICDSFKDISLVNRHRKIYEIFKDYITKDIHAMQIQTFTYSEWKNKNVSN